MLSPNWGNQSRYGEFEIVGAREKKPRLLGEGSFGKTFEAVRQDFVAGRVIKDFVALKVLNPALLVSDSKRLQFVQELVALTRFKHSNLIHYVRCGEEHGEVFYAMELCRGGDLAKLVRRYGALPEKVAAHIGLQVAAGMREVHHRHRLVHRDIKPSNIMLVDELDENLGVHHLAARFEEQDSLCRIVDFGLVDFALNAQEEGAVPLQQRFVGSPMYASPEQVREQPVDGRSDIYSLGMTLWFLVQGKGPMLDAKSEDLRDQKEAMRRHTDLTVEHSASFPANLSESFRRILGKMVAKRPEARYAGAAELQAAFRQYLAEVEAKSAPAFSITRVTTPLEGSYSLDEVFPSRVGRKSFSSVYRQSGARVKLTVVEDLETMGADTDVEGLVAHLTRLAEISCQDDFPDALLRVTDVILASDLLAFVEELPAGRSLAEVLRVRSRMRRPVSFAEAVSVLRPISLGLDYLIQHGSVRINLPGEEIWVNGGPLVVARPGDEKVMCKPFVEWDALRVRFSMMWLPGNPGRTDLAATMTSTQHTVSSSQQGSDSTSHPIMAFCRLVYRILNGSEIAAAAEYIPNAYVQSAALGPASNNLIRDLVCGQAERVNTGAVLSELCINEGVVSVNWPSGTKPGGKEPKIRSSQGSSSIGGTKGTETGAGPGAFGDPQTVIVEGEQQCEVVRPGLVVSPYDRQRSEIAIPPRQWVPSGRLRCPATQRFFRLPKRLDPLVAEVISPGVIHSPFADPGQNMKVPWESWVPGTEVLCADTGKKITLPPDLPLPPGSIPPFTVGKVISPYVAGTQFDVSPDLWSPGNEVICPVTGLAFVMPENLPPLEAIADLNKPGVLSSPYAPGVSWQILPIDWTAGGRIVCPATHRELVRPGLVERWVPETRVANASLRMVQNPFRSGATVQIPAIQWQPGNVVIPIETGRPILLPRDIPPLHAEIIEGRVDVVRSPYTGDVIPVTLNDWVPGGSIVCPRTGAPIILPDSLPERIPVGDISKSSAGVVISPYEPHSEFPVPAEKWTPGGRLVCPVTGRKFALPSSLPLLEARVKPGHPGLIASPFAPGTEFKISIDEWVPGARRECSIAHRPFVLPESLEEWIVEGQWVPMQPGCVRSPFLARPVITVPPESWKAGALITCSVARRRFSLPKADVLPSLSLEKEAVEYALSQPPSTSESDAAGDLEKRFPEASAKLIKSIWARHALAGRAEREKAQSTRGEPLPNEPGFVLSPYGSKPRVEVVPEKWVERGAAVRCPETGRRFLLPENLPHLNALLVPNQPGSIISPFHPDKPVEVQPAEWEPGRVVKCAFSGHPLRLPARLPVWRPVAKVPDEDGGIVLSPFVAGERITIDGREWKPGQVITCPVTRKEFMLPEVLPPLVAKNVRPGLAESPYVPGPFFPVGPDQWKPRGLVLCPQTQRLFKLPDRLPEKEWPANVVAPGIVQTPYGSHQEVEIPGPEWASGTSHRCPETGRNFVLPEKLPPLEAVVASGSVGRVHSPYVAPDRTSGIISISLRDWEPGFRAVCPVTSRICVLPNNLPVWEGEALLVPGQPGTVESPYRHTHKIKVLPDQWNPGEHIMCAESGRRFRLPEELPLLEGRVADAARGLVISPHDESSSPQAVSDENWVAEKVITCVKTGKPFRLPKDLGVLALEATAVGGKPGVVRSPYGRKLEVPVPGPDWLAGARVTCPETGKTFVMPAGLAPLTGTLVEGKTGRVISPYSGVATETRVRRGRWQPGAPVTCRATKRVFLLPKNLPLWVQAPMHWSVKAAAIAAVVAVIAFAAWWGLQLHQQELLRRDVATKEKIQQLEARLSSSFDRQTAEEYCSLTTELLPRISDPAERTSLAAAVEVMRRRIAGESAGAELTRLEAQLAANFDPALAKRYCGLLTASLSSVSDSGDIAKIADKFADMQLRILGAETGEDVSGVKPDDFARRYYAATARGAAGETERELTAKAMRQSNDRVALLVVASEALAVRGMPAAYDECFKAASAGIVWAQEKLKEKFVANVDESKPLRAIIPEGLAGAGTFAIPRAEWKPGPCEYKEGGKPVRWFRLPDKLPAVPPSRFILAGGFQIEGLEKVPGDLAVTVGGKSLTEKNTLAADQASFGPVGDDLAGKNHCELEFRLPGWMTTQASLQVGRDGDFICNEPVRMTRERWPLPLSIPGEMDYDYVQAEWVGPLPDQPLAVKVPPQDKQLKVSGKPDQFRIALSKDEIKRSLVPSGIYRVTLTCSESSKIADFVWPDTTTASSESLNQPVLLPATVAGKYYGLMTTIIDKGKEICIFATLDIGKRLKSVKFSQAPAIINDKTGLIYTYSSIDQQSRTDLTFNVKDVELQMPTRLRFQAPFAFGWMDWTFEAGSGAGATPQMRHQAVQATSEAQIESIRLKRTALHNSTRGVPLASKTGQSKLDSPDEFREVYREFLESDKALIQREKEESIDLHAFVMYPSSVTLKPWKHPVGTSAKMEWDVQPAN